MISKEELPGYAGLFYIIDKGGDYFDLKEVKKAPLIHRNNNVDKKLRILIDKFYFQHEKMRSEYYYAKSHLKNYDKLRSENSRLLSLIDLDKNTFEVFEGFNQKPLDESERFYYLQTKDEKYYPVRLLKSYDINNLPDEETFIKDCTPPEETEEN